MDFGFTLINPLSKTAIARLSNRSSNRFLVVLPAFLSFIISIGLVVLSVAPVVAQDTSTVALRPGASPSPGLTVISNPEGALVELRGVADLAGLSPVFFSQGIPGRYELRVSKTGYETYHTTVIIDDSQVKQVDVRLDSKTRGKAAIRSLLLPGWGQFYASQKTKGAVMTTLALAAGAAVALAEIDYQDKRDDFDFVNASYQNALNNGSSANIPVLFSQLSSAQEDAHDAESLRRAAFGGAIAVWTLSFLDALFFFPSVDQPTAARKITIAPESDLSRGYAGISFSASF